MNPVLPEFPAIFPKFPKLGRLLCQLLSLNSERVTPLDGIDEAQWNEIIRLAGNYQLTSVLYYNLKRMRALASLPDSARSVLSEGI